MKKTIKVERREQLVGLADTIVYAQKEYWCGISARQLRLSFLKARQCFPYDDHERRWPLLVFLCGGSFHKMDRNAWMGELAWFAKNGVAVASVEYSVLPYTKWPEQLQEIKQAIRFLRAHADDFMIMPDKIALMGESAGAYFATVAGLCGENREYDVGEHLEQPSTVSAVVDWYPPVRFAGPLPPGKESPIKVSLEGFLDPTTLVSPASPPFLMLHGTNDNTVPDSQSDMLYDALEKAGVKADLYKIDGADHADVEFAQTEVKQIILDFLKKQMDF